MSDMEAVLAANASFYRAFEKRDLTGMSSVWSKGTASLCIHPGRSALKGWDEIRPSWEQIFNNTRYLEIEIDVQSTEISGDLAYVVLVETVMQVIGNRRMQARSMATNIFERMGNGWFLVHHHGSPLM